MYRFMYVNSARLIQHIFNGYFKTDLITFKYNLIVVLKVIRLLKML